jgi:hypothetical protein
LLGTLSATDIDTADNELTFTTTSTDFKIVNNNELRTKRPLTTTTSERQSSYNQNNIIILMKFNRNNVGIEDNLN